MTHPVFLGFMTEDILRSPLREPGHIQWWGLVFVH